MSQPMPPSFSAAPKKKGPLFWILIAVTIIVVLGGTVLGVAGYFIYRAASNAGIDTKLFQTNPALATAKLAVAMNPDMETLSIDEATGLIQVRSKSSGKIATLRFDPATKSLISVSNDGAEVRIGDTQVSLPDWLAPYPGTKPEGRMTSKAGKDSSTTFIFKTTDRAEKVLGHFAEQARKAGLEITSNSTLQGGGMLLAEDLAPGRTSKRQMVVTMSATGDVVLSVSESH